MILSLGAIDFHVDQKTTLQKAEDTIKEKRRRNLYRVLEFLFSVFNINK